MRSYEKPKARKHLLEDLEIKRVEKNIQTKEEDLIFHGILYTGLRISEFIHIRRSWIDFKNNFLKIPEVQPCKCKGCIKIRNDLRKKLEFTDKDDIKLRHRTILEGNWLPKTPYSARTIPLLKNAQDVLYPYFKEHNLMLDAFPLRQYVNTILTQLSIRTFGKPKKNKKKLFPHALRGSFATMLAKDNFSNIGITRALGWADMNTARYYIDLTGSALKDEFDEKWSR